MVDTRFQVGFVEEKRDRFGNLENRRTVKSVRTEYERKEGKIRKVVTVTRDYEVPDQGIKYDYDEKFASDWRDEETEEEADQEVKPEIGITRPTYQLGRSPPKNYFIKYEEEIPTERIEEKQAATQVISGKRKLPVFGPQVRTPITGTQTEIPAESMALTQFQSERVRQYATREQLAAAKENIPRIEAYTPETARPTETAGIVPNLIYDLQRTPLVQEVGTAASAIKLPSAKKAGEFVSIGELYGIATEQPKFRLSEHPEVGVRAIEQMRDVSRIFVTSGIREGPKAAIGLAVFGEMMARSPFTTVETAAISGPLFLGATALGLSEMPSLVGKKVSGTMTSEERAKLESYIQGGTEFWGMLAGGYALQKGAISGARYVYRALKPLPETKVTMQESISKIMLRRETRTSGFQYGRTAAQRGREFTFVEQRGIFGTTGLENVEPFESFGFQAGGIRTMKMVKPSLWQDITHRILNLGEGAKPTLEISGKGDYFRTFLAQSNLKENFRTVYSVGGDFSIEGMLKIGKGTRTLPSGRVIPEELFYSSGLNIEELKMFGISHQGVTEVLGMAKGTPTRGISLVQDYSAFFKGGKEVIGSISRTGTATGQISQNVFIPSLQTEQIAKQMFSASAKATGGGAILPFPVVGLMKSSVQQKQQMRNVERAMQTQLPKVTIPKPSFRARSKQTQYLMPLMRVEQRPALIPQQIQRAIQRQIPQQKQAAFSFSVQKEMEKLRLVPVQTAKLKLWTGQTMRPTLPPAIALNYFQGRPPSAPRFPIPFGLPFLGAGLEQTRIRLPRRRKQQATDYIQSIVAEQFGIFKKGKITPNMIAPAGIRPILYWGKKPRKKYKKRRR